MRSSVRQRRVDANTPSSSMKPMRILASKLYLPNGVKLACTLEMQPCSTIINNYNHRYHRWECQWWLPACGWTHQRTDRSWFSAFVGKCPTEGRCSTIAAQWTWCWRCCCCCFRSVPCRCTWMRPNLRSFLNRSTGTAIWGFLSSNFGFFKMKKCFFEIRLCFLSGALCFDVKILVI